MAKSNYKIKWYDYLVTGVVCVTLSLLITFKWFSSIIGDKSYEELGASKTSGLAYAVAQLEGSNWRFLLALIFLIVAIINFIDATKAYKNREVLTINESKNLNKLNDNEKELVEKNNLDKIIRKQQGKFKNRF